MKKVFFILLLSLVTDLCFAQKNSFFNTDEKKIIAAVVNDAVYVLRQDFYILDTVSKPNKKIGLNGNKFFGRYYFVAILADGKFYTDDKINSPWNLDKQFCTMIDTKKYLPQLGNLAYKKMGEKEFKQLDSITTYNEDRSVNIDSTISYAILRSPDSFKGLALAPNNEKLLDSTSFHLCVSVQEAKEYSNNLYVDSLPSIEFDLSKGKFNLNKNAYTNTGFFYNENTIGGFIFITKPSFGKIEYFLSGIISRNKLGKFDMIAFKPKENKKKESKKETKVNQETKKQENDIPAKITEIKD